MKKVFFPAYDGWMITTTEGDKGENCTNNMITKTTKQGKELVTQEMVNVFMIMMTTMTMVTMTI